MTKKDTDLTRRDFVKKGSAGLAVGAAAANMAWIGPRAYAQGATTPLRLGIVGCGGRGTGAVFDHLNAAEELDANVKLVAMADIAQDRLDSSRNSVKQNWEEKGRYDVADDHTFVGINAYQNLCALDDVDVVIQTTPPGLRFLTLAEAVKNGKHSFVEKPVCVDADTYRSVIASGKTAKDNGLAIVSGTQYRRENSYIDAVTQINDGLIGEITGGFAYYCAGTQWHRGNGPADAPWSEMEYQMRNWPYFPWLSGDLIAEQSVHNIDVLNWVMGGPPARCYASGGRTARTQPEYGTVFDHFDVDYTYPNGVRMSFMGRQWPSSANKVENRFVGTKGVMDIQPNPGRTRWIAKTHDGEELGRNMGRDGNNQPYVEEHKALISGILNNNPVMEIQEVADSSMAAIIGRESAYSGKEVDFAWMCNNSQLKLRPDSVEPGKKIELGPANLPEATAIVRVPGSYQLV